MGHWWTLNLFFNIFTTDLVTCAGFVSIDYGSTAPYTDSKTGIRWVPDSNYTSLGKDVADVPGSSGFIPQFGQQISTLMACLSACTATPRTPTLSFLLWSFGLSVLEPLSSSIWWIGTSFSACNSTTMVELRV